MYGYTMPLFYECYMRYGPHLTGVDHAMDHIITSNYTPDVISGYPGSSVYKLEPWPSAVVWCSKVNDTCMDMLPHCFRSIILSMDHI